MGIINKFLLAENYLWFPLCCNFSKHQILLIYSPRSTLQVFSGSHTSLKVVVGNKTKSRQSNRGATSVHPCLYILRRKLWGNKRFSSIVNSSCLQLSNLQKPTKISNTGNVNGRAIPRDCRTFKLYASVRECSCVSVSVACRVGLQTSM